MHLESGRRLLCLGGSVMLLAMAAAGIPVHAETESGTFTEGKLTFEYVDGGVSVIAAEQDVTSLVIPDKAGGQPVIRIGEAAFENCSALTDVTIADGVQTIEPGAFFYCLALEHIEIPDSVTEIGGYAFANCYALREITLPQHLKAVGEYTFYYNIGLEEITLPPETEQVGYMSFAGCYSLRAMHLPASLIYFSDSAAVSCVGLSEIDVDPENAIYYTDDAGALLTRDNSVFLLYPAGSQAESYAVPDGVAAIAAYSFSGAVKLREITIPDTVTTIAAGAFSECRSLEAFDYPPLTEIAACAFADCSALKQFTIPETVKAIGQNAFYGCSALTEIVIPQSVEKVLAWAFCGCTGIQKIIGPDSVTDIEDCAFGYVPNTDAAAAEDAMLLQEGFVLAGSAESQAKQYAVQNGISFEQIGLSKSTVTLIIAGVCIALLIAVTVLLMRRRKQTADALPAVTAETAAEPETDPNYTSILAADDDEDEDPYDRSYGFQIEDGTESDSDEPVPAEADTEKGE